MIGWHQVHLTNEKQGFFWRPPLTTSTPQQQKKHQNTYTVEILDQQTSAELFGASSMFPTGTLQQD